MKDGINAHHLFTKIQMFSMLEEKCCKDTSYFQYFLINDIDSPPMD